jgi:Phospholipase_D-nuclease N-terminal
MLAVVGLGGFEIIFILGVILVVLPLAVAVFAFWIWMLISAIQNKGLTDGEKIGWVIAIALLHFLGAILYFFIGHPKRKMSPT